MKPLTMEDAEKIFNKLSVDHGEEHVFSEQEEDTQQMWLEMCHEIQSYIEENSK
jgi:hypothetical protein